MVLKLGKMLCIRENALFTVLGIKSVVFAATLISSESLKLDMGKLFNLHWIIQICPTREETNIENKNLEAHKNQRWLRASKYRHYVIV